MCNWVKLSEQAPKQDQCVDVWTSRGLRVTDLVYTNGKFFYWEDHLEEFEGGSDGEVVYWCQVITPHGVEM